MKAPLDRALFPQSLLRFLATGERLGTAPHRMIDVFLAAFSVSGARRGDLAQLAARLQSGVTLAVEAGRHPALFAPWLVALLRFGQKSGRMQDALDWAAAELDRQARASRAVTMALAYPAMLVTCASFLVMFSATFTAPQFRSIFNSMEATRLGSAPFDSQWPLAAVVGRAFLAMPDCASLLGMAMTGWVAMLAIALVPGLPGHHRLHALMRRVVPGARGVDRQAREALLARLLASGLTAGVPLPELLDEVAGLDDGDYRVIFQDAAARFRTGAPATEAFARAEGTAAAPFALALAGALAGPATERVLERIADVAQARAADDLERLPRKCGPLFTLLVGAGISLLPLAHFAVLLRLSTIVTAY